MINKKTAPSIAKKILSQTKQHPYYTQMLAFHYFNALLYDKKATIQDDLGICLKEKREGRFVIGAPEFIIEVTSSDPAYEYKIKYDLYQKAGVLEYWIVHPRDGVVVQNIFDKTKRAYKDPVSFSIENDKEVVSEVIPEFSINLKETFKFHF